MSWHPNGCRLRVSCGTMPKFLETMADRAQSSRKETETRVVEKPSHAIELPPTGWAALLRGLLCRCPRCGERSEEHTSELQSLMRISYAVFCLKKQKSNI